MSLRCRFVALAAVVVAACLSAPLSAVGQSSGPYLFRNPSLSKSSVAFLYADDIWTVSRSGGAAERLTSQGDVDEGPYYSPDGNFIAYSAEVHGAPQVFVIPSAGGIPKQITWRPEGSYADGWTPDGKDVIFGSMRLSVRDYLRIFKEAADGSGIPEALPLPMAYNGSFSPDGEWFAYEPVSRWERDSWKRYHGGQNFPIWIVNLKTLDLEKIPSANTEDLNPVWVGDSIYFLSDRDEADSDAPAETGAGSYEAVPKNGPMTLWRYDTKTKRVVRVIDNHGLDLKTIAAGPGGLVYEQFGSLHLIDLPSPDKPGTDHTLAITLHGDFPRLAPHEVTISPMEIQNAALSPTGKRAVFEAHGEIFTVPAEKGDTRNLTNTPGVEERDPAWSADGQRIAYFSDASGEYQLFIRDQTGFKPPIAISLGSDPSYFSDLAWSPDSKRLIYTDKHNRLWYIDAPADANAPKTAPVMIDKNEESGFGASFGAVWSPDSKWVAYAKPLPNHLGAIFLYSPATGKSTQVTDGMSDASSPAFDPNGKYLYFLASTDDGPSNAGIDLSSLDRAQTSAAYVAVLAKDEPSPVPPESDDEAAKKEETKPDAKADETSGANAGKDEKAKQDAAKSKPVDVKVDLDGIGSRILSLPVPARNYLGLATGKTGTIFLLEGGPLGRSSYGGPGIRAVWRFTLKDRKPETVLDEIDGFTVSADGSKALIAAHGSFSIADTDALKPGGGSGKPLNMGGMRATIDLRAQWKQMYHETWRIERDYLYDPNTHGLSIPKIEAKYEPYLANLASRAEFTYLSDEMLGEITIGHMFIRGPHEHGGGPQTGLLGADYTVENGRYRIAHILGGENWVPGMASPLTLPGVSVKEGEYLLAVNGRDLHASDNLYKFFEGTAGQQTVLHVGPNPDGTGARDVTVVPIANENALRNLDWIQSNIRKVDKLSDGKVAYVYMPNTAGDGYTNFNRYFYAQLNKQALVLDERWNEGGLIANYIIETLERKPLAGAVERDGKPLTDPVGAIYGPKVMLINQNSGSGGDAMPWYFRKAGVGKLIGVRTWGGLVGIGGYPVLMDGGSVTAPRYAIYGLHGQWEVENHGIAPDVAVEETPKEFAAGDDAQLEAGVKTVLDELKAHPIPAIPVPTYPNYHKSDGLGK